MSKFKKVFFSGSLVFLMTIFLSGCSIDEIKKGATDLWRKGQEKIENVTQEPENSNPKFAEAKEVLVESGSGQEVNNYLKSIFKKLFIDSKITERSQLSSTPFTLKYVLKTTVKKEDMELLLPKLLETGSLVKEDAPVNYDESKNIGQFSIYHNFGGRRFTIALLFDFEEQVVWANAY